MCLAVRFMAPELARRYANDDHSDDNTVSTIDYKAVDVFSYATVLWTLLTRQVPFKELAGVAEDIAEAILEGKRASTSGGPTRAAGTLLEDIMERCWLEDPRRRPTFSAIVVRR